MDWTTFRALETFAILYDIQVDEEDYGAGEGCRIRLGGDDAGALDGTLFADYEPAILRSPNRGNVPRREWERSRLRLPYDAIPAWRVELSVDSGVPAAVPGWTPSAGVAASFPMYLEPAGHCDVSEAWRCLVAAKLTRGRLMLGQGSAAEPALDELASLLLKGMPAVSQSLLEERIGSGSVSAEERQRFLLRVLYLCEAAACSVGLRSIAYADEAAQLVRHVASAFYQQPHADGKGETPYELLALYNKAQGRLHARNHEEAYGLFAEVARYMADAENVNRDGPPLHYFEVAAEPLSDLRWDRADLPLFRAYIGVPSSLQAAETLINLQRSHDAQEKLPKGDVGEDLTEYQCHRRDVIVKKIENDTGASLGSH